jgi:hypothetical protein
MVPARHAVDLADGLVAFIDEQQSAFQADIRTGSAAARPADAR